MPPGFDGNPGGRPPGLFASPGGVPLDPFPGVPIGDRPPPVVEDAVPEIEPGGVDGDPPPSPALGFE
jgi:hypothetical protein